MNALPEDFIDAYKKCIHYQSEDWVLGIEAGWYPVGCTFMSLVIERVGYQLRLPFYFNQTATENKNGSEKSEYEAIIEDPNSWIETMAGATDWVAWYNSAGLKKDLTRSFFPLDKNFGPCYDE